MYSIDNIVTTRHLGDKDEPETLLGLSDDAGLLRDVIDSEWRRIHDKDSNVGLASIPTLLFRP